MGTISADVVADADLAGSGGTGSFCPVLVVTGTADVDCLAFAVGVAVVSVVAFAVGVAVATIVDPAAGSDCCAGTVAARRLRERVVSGRQSNSRTTSANSASQSPVGDQICNGAVVEPPPAANSPDERRLLVVAPADGDSCAVTGDTTGNGPLTTPGPLASLGSARTHPGSTVVGFVRRWPSGCNRPSLILKIST
ncbi:hypothetical protein ACWDV4_21655 [Micromonospora sp. NPDC003197]